MFSSLASFMHQVYPKLESKAFWTLLFLSSVPSWLIFLYHKTLEVKPSLKSILPILISEWVKVTQLCLTLCNPMDCNPPGSSVHGNLQARILKLVTISFSRRSSWPRDWIWVFCILGRYFTIWATREAQTGF